MPALRVALARVGLPGARLLIVALACAGAPPSPSAGEGAVEVRFVEPAPPGLVLGVTRITVEATAPAGAGISGVAIYVDGHLLTRMTRPPYTVTWDAGARFVHRTLRAVATDSEGRTGEAALEVRPLYVGQYEEVRLVNLYATVRDRDGRPSLDLAKDDFAVLEDGVPQTISHFSAARVPLTVALLLDASNSMGLGGKLDLAKKAAVEFADAVDPDDRLMVLPFNDDLRGQREPASERRRLREAIAAIRPGGGTALYDALYKTADLLTGIEGRRAIILLSDGRDQALTDNEPGSLHLFEEALQRAHRAEVAIYAVGLGRHLDTEMDLQHARSLKEILETLARQTGGRSYFPERAGQLSGIYRQIASDLAQQYTLAYSSSNAARDGRWRAIRVTVSRPGLEVQARSGYYAPGPGTP